MLGPLRATHFAFGDIVTPDLPLLARARPERGAMVSNFPLYQGGEFDRTTLIGDLLEGWDVELYRREELLDFGRAGEDGRYVFEDIPLLYGANDLRLVFHGPQGQRREETRYVLVGLGSVPPGEHRYRMVASQRDTSLFEIDSGTQRHELQGGGRVSAEYETGLTQGLSLVTRMASLPLDDGRHSFGTAGLRGSAAGVFGTGDVMVDATGEWAAQGGLQTTLGGLNMVAEQTFVSEGFRSERENTGADPVRSRSAIGVTGSVRAGTWPPLGYSLGAEHEFHESGRQQTSLTNRLSARIGGVSMTNRLRLRLSDSGPGGDTREATGDGVMIATGRLGFARLRGGLDYRFSPDVRVHGVNGSLDLQVSEDVLLRTGITHSLVNERATIASIGLSRTIGPAAVGVTARYADSGAYQATVSLSFSLGEEPRSGRWSASPRSQAGHGAVSARVFLDRNASGVLDEGDEVLEGVEMVAGNARYLTGADGVAFMTGLPGHRPLAVRINPGSLPDPFLVPTRDGIETVPRAGAVAVLEFPVVMTGEIDGTIFVLDADGRHEAAGVELELVDSGDVVRQRTRSAFDGFYLFEQVRPGAYRVGIGQSWADGRGLERPALQDARITGEGNIVGGLDFVLRRLGG